MSLASIQTLDFAPNFEEENTSLLMDVSISDLQKGTPGRVSKSRINADDLNKLNAEELEMLAWEAMEEERRLEEKRKKKRSACKEDDPMKNVTVRRKSNSPRKEVQNEVEKMVTPPLPRTISTSTIKHVYDRQASPTRSALRQQRSRKSVAFGIVQECEMSITECSSSSNEELHGNIRPARSLTLRTKCKEGSGSSLKAEVSGNVSSSPLSRCKGKLSPLRNAISKPNQESAPSTLPIRSCPRLQSLAKSSKVAAPMFSAVQGSKAEKMTAMILTKTSPVSKARVRQAIQESAAKARVRARQSRMRAKAKEGRAAPAGFRLSSTGTLVPQLTSKPFLAATALIEPRKSRSSIGRNATKTDASSSKANPVPVWLKRRKETLEQEEETRLQEELERVRARELGPDPGVNADTGKKRTQPSIAPPSLPSAMNKRMAERATWEARRKAKDELIAEEKQKARKERQEREDEEYRLARQRTVVRANPVPAFIRARAAK